MTANIVIRSNLKKGIETIEINEPKKIIDIMKELYPKGIRHNVEYFLNGKKISPDKFYYKLVHGDTFEINLEPGFGFLVFLGLALVLGAVMYVLYKLENIGINEEAAGDNVNNSLEYMGIKTDSPIGIGYGKVRITPDLVTKELKINKVRYYV